MWKFCHPRYELKEALAEMRAQFHPSMLDRPDDLLYAKIECDMTGKKPVGRRVATYHLRTCLTLDFPTPGCLHRGFFEVRRPDEPVGPIRARESHLRLRAHPGVGQGGHRRWRSHGGRAGTHPGHHQGTF